jgi:hypothetical protein
VVIVIVVAVVVPTVAVTVHDAPAELLVVNVVVAIPIPFVVEDDVTDPLPVIDQLTVVGAPLSATGRPLASANWAVIVTELLFNGA